MEFETSKCASRGFIFKIVLFSIHPRGLRGEFGACQGNGFLAPARGRDCVVVVVVSNFVRSNNCKPLVGPTDLIRDMSGYCSNRLVCRVFLLMLMLAYTNSEIAAVVLDKQYVPVARQNRTMMYKTA